MTKEKKEKMYRYARKVAYYWLGVIMIIFGLIGLLFPVIPGFVLLFIGLGLVNRSQHEYSEHRFIKYLNSLKARYRLSRDCACAVKPLAKAKVRAANGLKPSS